MSLRVEQWKEMDRSCYVTKAVEEVTRKVALNMYNYISVSGEPGAGKSTAVRHAALRLQTQSGYQIYPVTRITEFITYLDPNVAQVFVFDDPIGDHGTEEAYDPELYNETIKKCSKSYSATKVLMVLRNNLFFDPGKDKFPCLFKYRYHNIDMKRFKLSREEMKGMMALSLTMNHVNSAESLVANLFPLEKKGGVDINTSMFPLLCQLYSREPRLRRRKKHLFTNPHQTLLEFFKEMKTRRKLLSCGLVLCSLFGGKLSENLLNIDGNLTVQLTHVKLRDDVLHSFEIDKNNLKEVKFALQNQEGLYTVKLGNTYEFTNSLFHDILAFLYRESFSVFEYGSLNFIIDNVRIKKVDNQQVLVIQGDKHINLLAKRFVREFQQHPGILGNLMRHYNIPENKNLISGIKHFLQNEGKLSYGNDLDVWLNLAMTEIFNRHFSCLVEKREKNPGSMVSDLNWVLMFIEVGANANTYLDKLGCYPIHLAIIFGRMELLERLLDQRADTTKPYDKKIFASLIKCVGRTKELKEASIKQLLKSTFKAPDTNTRISKHKKASEKKPQSIFECAFKFAVSHLYKVAKLLLEHNANVRSVSTSGESVLHSVIKVDKVNSIQLTKLFIKWGASVQAISSKTGESLLHYVVKYNNEKSSELAELFLFHGADVNAVQKNGESVLHYVVKYNNKLSLKLGQLFLQNGAYPNAIDRSERSALHMTACCHDNDTLKLAELLIANGADVNIEDGEGQSVLHHVIICNARMSLAIAKLLISNGANTNAVSRSDVSVLHYLAYFKNDNAVELAKYVLKFHGNVDYICHSGDYILKHISPISNPEHILDICQWSVSVLHLVAMSENSYAVELADVFLNHGADVNAVDRQGFSVLYHAFSNKKNPRAHDLVQLFINWGAKTDAICHREGYIREVIKSNRKLSNLLSKMCSDL